MCDIVKKNEIINKSYFIGEILIVLIYRFVNIECDYLKLICFCICIVYVNLLIR